ncbi:MAG: 50S ribosomal protein L25 [Candidatus Dormibacteraeota bacterium]|nr:50S ribosomal protein L25 [Candidatus Dormibacteraeota bacterium]MBV9524708.1 50S ribosomal protein L25 [Candidatus Dormibacteraeota bacterium]
MAGDLTLDATRRTETGRHAHALRRRGLVPAVLYGHRVEPTSLSIDERGLQRVWHRAGHSHLVDLTLDGGRARKVLIRELQMDPRTAGLLHVDLFAVNLREKLTVDVPLIPIGESPVVSEEKIGVVQQIVNTLKVECLPSDIPAQLTVDISGLTEIDAGVHLRDVPLPEGVSLAHGLDPDELVVKVAPIRVAVEEEEAAEEAPAEEAAGEAGEAPAAEQSTAE